jgi:hypothetical protein
MANSKERSPLSGDGTNYLHHKDSLEKTFTHEDGVTMTDPRAHYAAVGPIPRALIEWGREHLISMDHVSDGPKVLELDGKIIRVRKVLEDLYSGWIEKDGSKIHQFEKLGLPELLSQIQSKLELYGREEEAVAEDKKVHVAEAAQGSVTAEEAIDEALEGTQVKADTVKEKLNELKETISRKEIVEGMIQPEKECPACERKASECVCYTGLPKPRVEFDGKKVTIFFKSEWNEIDRENFSGDLKKRAGDVLQKRRINEAREVLKKLKNNA